MPNKLKKKILIIAEVGVNHNGRISIAKKLIDQAKIAGADAVKFQTWKKGELTGKFTQNLPYIKKGLKKKILRHKISDKYQLTYNQFKILQKYCKKKQITFLSTPDGFESLNFLCNDLDIPFIKIGSTELNHDEFLKAACAYNKEIFLSTGMSTFEEVKHAVEILRKNKSKFTILHCVSEYPTPIENINVLSIKFLQDKLKVPVGFSDHTKGFLASIVAVGLGVKVIEKHITLNNFDVGPDHSSSLNPKNFKIFVNKIREAELSLGEYQKKPTKLELKNLPNVRRGVVAKKQINKNSILKKSMLTCKRPFKEISPNEIKKIYGRRIKIDLDEDQPILWKYLV